MDEIFSFESENRTDLACEQVVGRVEESDEVVEKTTVTLSEDEAKALGKRAGRYSSVASEAVKRGERERYPRLVRALAGSLKEAINFGGGALVVGLGNPSLRADAFGAETVRGIAVSAADGGLKTLLADVSSRTGIESFDLVRAVVERVKPNGVIAVDSLCARSGARLGAVFQVSDAGIVPGSGVGNARAELSERTLGVPTVCLGVPTVIYASTVAREAAGSEEKAARLILTLSEIDRVVADCGAIAASAINRAFGKSRAALF